MSRRGFYWRVAALCLGLLIAGLVGCAGVLEQELVRLGDRVETVRERGAMNCAPAALAWAEAHLDFSQYELQEGDRRRADAHKQLASLHVEEAWRNTEPKACADAMRRDSDGDGLADGADPCPQEPEDVDQFQDGDGCPDVDNDGDTVLDTVDRCPLLPGKPSEAGCPVADRDGDRIADGVDACPDQAEDLDGFQDADGCPERENQDTDGDGIMDWDDACPDDAEDKDLFQDKDGCPDLDNDEDGVADAVDRCPLEPGRRDKDGCPYSDRDADGIGDEVDNCPDVPGKAPSGCPERVLVEKTATAIEIKKKINFEINGSKIRGETSFEILRQVAAVMVSNPDIQLTIEGHTDSVGKADYNLWLSDERAKAVQRALVLLGVEAKRLQAMGFGEARPVASNKDSTGRATNRRVAFRIEQGGA